MIDLLRLWFGAVTSRPTVTGNSNRPPVSQKRDWRNREFRSPLGEEQRHPMHPPNGVKVGPLEVQLNALSVAEFTPAPQSPAVSVDRPDQIIYRGFNVLEREKALFVAAPIQGVEL